MRRLKAILAVAAVMVAMIVATAVPAIGSVGQAAQDGVSQALNEEQPMGEAANRAVEQAVQMTNEGKAGSTEKPYNEGPETGGVLMGNEATLLGLGTVALMVLSAVVLREIIG